MKKKVLLEKQVVDYIVTNWDKLMEDDIKFHKTEWQALSDYRADILGYTDIDLKDVGFTEESLKYRAAMVIECKYQSESRDLIYEMKKAMYLREFQETKLNRPFYIGVFSDDFSDKTIYNFLLENNIYMWKICIKDNDLSTLKLKYISPGETTEEDIKEVL